MVRRSSSTESLIEEMIAMQMTLFEIATVLECTVGDVIDHLARARGYVPDPPPAPCAKEANVTG